MKRYWMRTGADKKLWWFFRIGVDYGFYPGFQFGMGWKPLPREFEGDLQQFKFAFDVELRLPRIKIIGRPSFKIMRRR